MNINSLAIFVEFRADGYLPDGLYLASKGEVTFRFGASTVRRRLALRLRRWIELARQVGGRRLDHQVLELAAVEKTLLITEDKDFGQVVYAAGKETARIILIRFPAKARDDLPKAVQELLEKYGERLLGRFIVLQPGPCTNPMKTGQVFARARRATKPGKPSFEPAAGEELLDGLGTTTQKPGARGSTCSS